MTTLDNHIKPKFIPFLCPVCRGHKTVNWGKETCSVCGGKGYIEVPPEEEGVFNGKNY